MEPYYQFLIKYQDTKDFIQAQLDGILKGVKNLKEKISEKSIQEQTDYLSKGELIAKLQEYSDQLDQLKNFKFQKDKTHFTLNNDQEIMRIDINQNDEFLCKEHQQPYTKVCLQKQAQKHLFCDLCEQQNQNLQKFQNIEDFVYKLLRQKYQEMKAHIDFQIKSVYQRIIAEENNIQNQVQSSGQLATITALIELTDPFRSCEQLLREINQLRDFRFQYKSDDSQIIKLRKLDKLTFEAHDQDIEIQNLNPKFFDNVQYNQKSYIPNDKIIIENNLRELTMNFNRAILVCTQTSYEYKYIESKINNNSNLNCSVCKKVPATTISIDGISISIYCNNCSFQQQSKLLFCVQDISKYSNAIQKVRQNFLNYDYSKLDMPKNYLKKLEIRCIKQDHDENKISAICFSKSCDQPDFRLCCDACIQTHQHQGINQIKTIRSFQFEKYLDFYNLIENILTIEDKVINFAQNISRQLLDYQMRICNKRKIDISQDLNYFEMMAQLQPYFDEKFQEWLSNQIKHTKPAFEILRLKQIFSELNQKLKFISQQIQISSKPQQIELLNYINSSDNVHKVNKFLGNIVGHLTCLVSSKPCRIDKLVLPNYEPKIELTLILSYNNIDLIKNEIKPPDSNNSSQISKISQDQSQLKSKVDKVMIKLKKPLLLLANQVYRLTIQANQPWQMEEYRQLIENNQNIINQIRPTLQTEQDSRFIIRQFIIRCQVVFY